MPVSRVIGHHAALGQHGELDPRLVHVAEFSGSIPDSSELADEFPLGVDDDDPRCLAVEHVQVARPVERYSADIPERLPIVAGIRPHAIHFLKVRSEGPVLTGEFAHLLGGQATGVAGGDTREGGYHARGQKRH